MEGSRPRRNPFTSSAAGGRTLSALQLPFFLVLPPRGYGVLTTTGRASGKARRRCVRAIRQGDEVYVVAIKGTRTGWARNAVKKPDVRVRIRGGRFAGRAREPRDDAERERAREAYCETLQPFDRLTWRNWRKGPATPEGIKALLREWFDSGTPLVIELRR